MIDSYDRPCVKPGCGKPMIEHVGWKQRHLYSDTPTRRGPHGVITRSLERNRVPQGPDEKTPKRLDSARNLPHGHDPEQ